MHSDPRGTRVGPLSGRRRLAVAITMALAACSGETDGPDLSARSASSDAFCDVVASRTSAVQMAAVTAGATEASSGTAVVGAIAEMPGGMNAFVSADYVANQHQVFVNLMTLVRFDDRYQYEPYLAASWALSPDSTQLTFTLRDDIFWHDGPRTTAYDVAFTYETASNPETGFPNAALWSRYQAVEVVDSFTVRFTVEPHATVLDAWRTLAIMPEHLLGDVPVTDLAEHPYGMVCPVGNGPFRFVEHRDNDRWIFEANPTFPAELGGPPALDRYVYRIIPEEATLLRELLNGEVDVFVAPSPDMASTISERESARLLHYPFRQYAFVAWNSRRPQLKDPRVRQAIAMATNRAEMVDALLAGYGQVANTGVPPMHWAYDAATGAALPYDPAGAEALLDAAGWTDRDGDGVRENAEGVPLSFEILYNQGNQVRSQIAELMQAYLAPVGIEASPTMLEWAALLGAIMDPDARDFDGVVMGWLPDFTVDESDFFHSEKLGGSLAWAGMDDSVLDALLEKLNAAASDEEAGPLWRSYQDRIIELQPFTYLYFQERLDGVSSRLADVAMDARGEWVGIQQWRLSTTGRMAAGEEEN